LIVQNLILHQSLCFERQKDWKQEMGIFDDNAEEAEPRQVAQRVYEDLQATLPQNVVPELVGNHITLRASGGPTLTIVCDGPDAFRLQDDLGNKSAGYQTQITSSMARWSLSGRPFSQHEMVAKVKAWENEQLAA
jgi:hypothetical protein